MASPTECIPKPRLPNPCFRDCRDDPNVCSNCELGFAVVNGSCVACASANCTACADDVKVRGMELLLPGNTGSSPCSHWALGARTARAQLAGSAESGSRRCSAAYAAARLPCPGSATRARHHLPQLGCLCPLSRPPPSPNPPRCAPRAPATTPWSWAQTSRRASASRAPPRTAAPATTTPRPVRSAPTATAATSRQAPASPAPPAPSRVISMPLVVSTSIPAPPAMARTRPGPPARPATWRTARPATSGGPARATWATGEPVARAGTCAAVGWLGVKPRWKLPHGGQAGWVPAHSSQAIQGSSPAALPPQTVVLPPPFPAVPRAMATMIRSLSAVRAPRAAPSATAPLAPPAPTAWRAGPQMRPPRRAPRWGRRGCTHEPGRRQWPLLSPEQHHTLAAHVPDPHPLPRPTPQCAPGDARNECSSG